MGRDLLPAVLALMQWADKYLQGGTPPLLRTDTDTGAPVHVELRSATGLEIGLEQLSVRLNPEWKSRDQTQDTTPPE